MGRIEVTREDKVAARHYRRARVYRAPGDFDGWEWELVRAWWGGRCLRCGASGVTVDHVVPLSRGGRNDPSNLQLLCGPCNSAKGARVVDYRHPLLLVQLLELL